MDNNCQFHAVLHQLQAHEVISTDPEVDVETIDPERLRGALCDWLTAHAGLAMDDGSIGERCQLWQAAGQASIEDFHKYVDVMRIHGKTWGDDVTLLAVCALFNVRVHVVSSDGNVLDIEAPPYWGAAAEHDLAVGHFSEFHYVSTEPLPADAPPGVSE